ncbi:hypothetical protein [Prosthecomicrobium sp. N25]|uniref:hypothetical protein n=1 Tax=Prosthecomicrobium sp. N25 TaxID=3129254 RepID=UPI0030770E95
MDLEKFKAKANALKFRKDLTHVSREGASVVVKWTNKKGNAKSMTVELSPAAAALDEANPDFAEAAAKDFVKKWDAQKGS